MDDMNLKNNRNNRFFWIVSSVLACVFFALIIGMWLNVVFFYKNNNHKLTTTAAVEESLKAYDGNLEANLKIPMGILVQSFFFENAQTVTLTALFWQKYSPDVIQALGSEQLKGFILPENNQRIFPNILYKEKYPEYEVIGWGIAGAGLYEQFNYAKYPFDKQIIKVRMVPKAFYKNIVLVPDLDSYHITQKNKQIYGISYSNVSRGLHIKETYFSYENYISTVGFGFKNYNISRTLPQLTFNIVVSRDFFDIFLLYLLPVIVVWGLLFGLTMTMHIDQKEKDAYNFSTMGALTTLAGTFFAVLFSQINLRSNFSGQPVLYLEYFYFVTYLVIFLLALNSYAIAKSHENRLLNWRNNLFPKLIFWPFNLGVMAIVTYIVLYG